MAYAIQFDRLTISLFYSKAMECKLAAENYSNLEFPKPQQINLSQTNETTYLTSTNNDAISAHTQTDYWSAHVR